MSVPYEGRRSESPYIDMVWRGYVEPDNARVCPANANWNFLFAWYHDKVKVSAEGATSHHVPKFQTEGAEFLVIKFKLGVFMPYLPPFKLVDRDAILPQATSNRFYLNGSSWQLPDWDNVETFVERLVREEILLMEPVVTSVLHDQPPSVSGRTVRRRFLQATGLTPKTITQIERAQQAVSLLEQGNSIVDVAYQAGYADQPHMTRSLKRFFGFTPAQIAGGEVSG